MKKIVIVVVLFVGIMVYLFSYGDWEEISASSGTVDIWWFDSEDRYKNLSIDSVSFYEQGYEKVKIQLDNDISEGSYTVELVADNVWDISSEDMEWETLYKFPKMEVGTEGCELVLDEELIKNTNSIVTEYLEYTRGASQGCIMYGKKRRIIHVIEFFSELVG